MANHPLHPFPYPQSIIIIIIIIIIAYWQTLPMHHLQNTVSQTQYQYLNHKDPGVDAGLMLASKTDHCRRN